MGNGLSGSRIPVILTGILIVLAVSLIPVTAIQTDPGKNPENFGTPVVPALGIWEQDDSQTLEDGDTVHSIDGAQFLPSCSPGTQKEIMVFVIIPEEMDTNQNPLIAIIENPQDLFVRRVQLSALTQTEGIVATREAINDGLITYGTSASVDEIISDLREGKATVWNGKITLPSGQKAGYYSVIISNDNTKNTPVIANTFMYMPLACIEFDFSAVRYDDMPVGQEKRVVGDNIFGTGDKPSVRNTGNCPARIKIVQDDMGFGKNQNGLWNIRYGIRVGDRMALRLYEPEQDIIVADMIMPGSVEPIDFAIHVNEGQGGHSGSMSLSFDPADCEMVQPYASLAIITGNSKPIPEFPLLADFLRFIMKLGNEQVFA